jgi:hypothetical protein
MKTHAQENEVKTGAPTFSVRTARPRHRNLLVLAAMIVTLATAVGLSSCAGYTTNAAGTTSQGGSGTGVLSASTSTLDFGSVEVGSSATQALTLTDTGTAPVTISGVGVSGTGFNLVGGGFSGTVAVGQSVSVQLEFAPQSAGSISGSITVTSDASSVSAASTTTTSMITSEASNKSSFKVTLHGNATQALVSISPAPLSFSNVAVGQSSTQTATITNAGTANLQLKGASITGGGFSLSGLTVPQMIPAGQSVSFNVQYAPTAAGSSSGSVSLVDNAPASPQSLMLAGTAVATNGTLSASPSSYNFNSVVVGSNSQQTITLTNSGATTITINQVSSTGAGFSTSGITSGQTIAVGAQTSFTATFAPTVAGSASGTIAISTDASNPTLSIALSGTGLQASVSASPTSIAFGSVVVGNSNSDVITLKNSGNATSTFSQISVSGSGFSVSGISTSSTVAAGGTLNFNAVFTPASAISSSGSITLTTNGSPAQISISLTGSGTTASEVLSTSPSNLSFGNIQIGNSNSLTTTLTNTGNSNVTISGVTVTGAAYTTSGITPGMILSPNQSATLTVQFTPTSLGSNSGSVNIASSAANSPTTIALTGESHTVQLTWSASTSTGVTGYYVYRGTQSGQYTKIDPSSPTASPQFTDTTVSAGTTYYYVVTAVDSSGAESSYSSAAAVSVP